MATKTAQEKIAEYRTYNDGWRWGEGVAFSDLVVSNATLLNEKAHSVGMTRTDCFPGTDGTLQIAIYAERATWYFDAETDGSIYWSEEILGIEDEGKITLDIALKMIEEIGNKYGSAARGRAIRCGFCGSTPPLPPDTTLVSPLREVTRCLILEIEIGQ